MNDCVPVGAPEWWTVGITDEFTVVGEIEASAVGVNEIVTVGTPEWCTVGTDEFTTVGMDEFTTVGTPEWCTVGITDITIVGIDDNFSSPAALFADGANESIVGKSVVGAVESFGDGDGTGVKGSLLLLFSALLFTFALLDDFVAFRKKLSLTISPSSRNGVSNEIELDFEFVICLVILVLTLFPRFNRRWTISPLLTYNK